MDVWGMKKLVVKGEMKTWERNKKDVRESKAMTEQFLKREEQGHTMRKCIT